MTKTKGTSRNVVHPGTAKQGTEEVTFTMLCDAYGIDPSMAVNYVEPMPDFIPDPLDKHFYPREDGHYVKQGD